MTDTTDIKALREASEIGESSDYMTWPTVDPAKLKRVLDRLEAERQRADDLNYDLGQLQTNNVELSRECLQYKSELAELKAKLANPVVLKPAYKQSDYNRMGLEPSDAYGLAWGSSATRDDCVKQIREAGFTVKGE